jgi:hypothetical protein
MEINSIKRQRENGSVLFITLILAVILGSTLGGYLYWVHTQNLLVAQSQAWNWSLALAEAGIEEGMAQVNVAFGTNYLPSVQTNWTGPSGVLYGPRTSTFTNGSYGVVIDTSGPFPTITSTGYATVPFIGRQIARTVQVTTTSSSAFGNALTVRSNLTTKGSNLTVDSYDSSDPNHSTNGMYNLATRKAGGDVNSVGGLINVQNADIYGKLRTGPTGSYNIGNGSVGDLSWNVKGAIEPGWYANDFNADLKDVTPPYTSGIDALPVNVGTNTYVLGTGSYYHDGDFVLSQNQTLYIAGVVTLYVTGNFNMKSQNACFITIAPGASLQLFVGTPNGAPVSAALTQVNTAGNAQSFQYYGLPSNTTVTWNGNNTYVGTVYAPEADFGLGGGGSSIMDYQGAAVTLSATLNGHFNVHYDENLKRFGPPSGFTVTSWQEL